MAKGFSFDALCMKDENNGGWVLFTFNSAVRKIGPVFSVMLVTLTATVLASVAVFTTTHVHVDCFRKKFLDT
jgi:hypothetical protein